jgi:hypothetical protein
MCEQAVRQMTQVPAPARGTVAQCTRPTALRHRLLFMPLGALLALFMGMSGCVPVLHRPAATPVTCPWAPRPVHRRQLISKLAMAGSLAEEIHKLDHASWSTHSRMSPRCSARPGTRMIDPVHAAEPWRCRTTC